MKKLFWRLNYFLNMAPSILHDLWDESELEYGFKHPTSKSQALQNFAREMGVPFVDLPLHPVDPKDVYGMPTFVPRTDGDKITILDELPECGAATKFGITEAALFNRTVDVAIEDLLRAADVQVDNRHNLCGVGKTGKITPVKKPRKKAKKAK